MLSNTLIKIAAVVVIPIFMNFGCHEERQYHLDKSKIYGLYSYSSIESYQGGDTLIDPLIKENIYYELMPGDTAKFIQVIYTSKSDSLIFEDYMTYDISSEVRYLSENFFDKGIPAYYFKICGFPENPYYYWQPKTYRFNNEVEKTIDRLKRYDFDTSIFEVIYKDSMKILVNNKWVEFVKVGMKYDVWDNNFDANMDEKIIVYTFTEGGIQRSSFQKIR